MEKLIGLSLLSVLFIFNSSVLADRSSNDRLLQPRKAQVKEVKDHRESMALKKAKVTVRLQRLTYIINPTLESGYEESMDLVCENTKEIHLWHDAWDYETDSINPAVAAEMTWLSCKSDILGAPAEIIVSGIYEIQKLGENYHRASEGKGIISKLMVKAGTGINTQKSAYADAFTKDLGASSLGTSTQSFSDINCSASAPEWQMQCYVDYPVSFSATVLVEEI